MVDLIAETIDKLDVSTVEQVLAKLIGYEILPPPVEDIVKDPYFLGDTYVRGEGKLYPCWMERLKEVFPDRIRTSSTIIVNSGALGTGKSYFSQLILMIDLIKLSFVENPYKFFEIDRNTPFTFRYFNVDKGRANDVLLQPTLAILNKSPYIQERRKRTGEYLPHNVALHTAKRAGDVISEMLLCSILSEINFFKPWHAEEIISTVMNRLSSRFQKSLHLFSHVIMDSSATTEDSVLQKFLTNGKYADDVRVFTTSIWEAKKHQGIFFNNTPPSFKVYLGSATVRPFIIEHDAQIQSMELDKDRILDVPSELYQVFKLDIIKALQDSAGISVSTNEDYFGNKDLVKESMEIKPVCDEILTMDFFDNESIIDRIGLKNLLSLLPEERKIIGRVDLGISHDNAGIALGYCDKGDWEMLDKKRAFKGSYKVPFAVALSRKPGEETSIAKIVNFFIELSSYRDLILVTTDQYQSTSIRQDLLKANISSKLLSVDRSDNCYNLFKNLIYQGRIKIPTGELLLHELMNLYQNGGKVDHRSFSSKDMCDAIVGVIYTLYELGSDACNTATQKAKESYLQVLQKLAAQRERKSILNQYGVRT